jgi:hypothetical protein
MQLNCPSNARPITSAFGRQNYDVVVEFFNDRGSVRLPHKPLPNINASATWQ